MPELAEAAQLHVTSKGAARDRFPTRRGPSQPPHTPSPEKDCTNIVPTARQALLTPLLCVTKKGSSGVNEGTDAGRLKQGSLIICLHTYSKTGRA